MAYTYEKIASVIASSGTASSLDFASIPQRYTDLKLVASLRGTTGAQAYATCQITINGSGANITGKQLYGGGSGSGSSANATSIAFEVSGVNATASTFGTVEAYFPNYTSSNYKSVSVDSNQENNTTASYAQIMASLWSQGTAINQLTIASSGFGPLAQYSSATLYGIRNS
jgi:hypothetical protein